MKHRILSYIAAMAFLMTTFMVGKWSHRIMLEDYKPVKDPRAYYKPHRIIPDHQFALGAEVGDLMQVSAIVGLMVQSPLGSKSEVVKRKQVLYSQAKR